MRSPLAQQIVPRSLKELLAVDGGPRPENARRRRQRQVMTVRRRP